MIFKKNCSSFVTKCSKKLFTTNSSTVGSGSFKKKIWCMLHLTVHDFFNLDMFVKNITENLNINTHYTIICRISYMNDKANNATEYKMLGDQLGLFKSSHNDMYDWVLEYHKTIMSRLEQSMDHYDYNKYHILDLQFICKTYNTKTKLKIEKFKVDSLGLQKELIHIDKTVKGFNQLLPLSYDTSTFGILLSKNVVNNYVSDITLVNGKVVNILNLINDSLALDKKMNSIDGTITFYQGILRDKDILILVESSLSSNKIKIFGLNGMLINTVYDTKLSPTTFTRQIGNVKTYINEKGIYRKDILIDFPSVYSSPHKDRHQRLLQPEWKIGTLDLETYVDEDASKVYAIGFYIKDDCSTYYINNSLNSDSIIIECLDSMLSDKYNGYTFYVHNLSKFDIYYILPVLEKFNDLYPDKYIYKLLFRDNDVLGINLSTKRNNKTITIRIVDSYTMLQAKLHDLCETFSPSVSKSYFPYSFITKHNLFYVGTKPGIELYNSSIKDKKYWISKEEYDLLPSSWSTKDQTLDYLEKDLVSLFEVINTFKNSIYTKHHTHITNSLTISSLTMDIYLRRYYENKTIPLIKQKSIYNDIKQSYYGGITEVYRPMGTNLYYYDVNSLYPFAALNTMPGLQCTFTDKIDKDFGSIKDDLFGFYYCRVITNNEYLGLLPYRSKEGLIMPWGTFEGWYFSEELRFAYENNYTIQILKGYTFSKSDNVFSKYIHELYSIKRTTTDKVIKNISKSFLNNFLGRWGLDINKYITQFVSKDEFDFIMISRKIRNFQFIGEKVLVTFDKEISKDICESHNLDYIKVYHEHLNKNDLDNEKDSFTDVSVAIASAVTSYARIYMNKIKLDILAKGGKIYYTDTDSIVSDIKLDSSLVSDDIGKFKLEYEIQEGYFISNKTYGIKTIQNKIILKNKGIFNNSLSFDDFKSLYKGESVLGTRYESIKNYNKGVLINIPKTIKLSPYSYTKRIKLYNNNVWHDTKPLTIKNYSILSTSRTTTMVKTLQTLFNYTYFIFISLSYILSLFLHTIIEDDLLDFHFFYNDDFIPTLTEDDKIELLFSENELDISSNYLEDLFSFDCDISLLEKENNSMIKRLVKKLYSLFDQHSKSFTLDKLHDKAMLQEITTTCKVVQENQMDTDIKLSIPNEPIVSSHYDLSSPVVYEQVNNYIIEIEELKKKISSLEREEHNRKTLIDSVLYDLEKIRDYTLAPSQTPLIRTPLLRTPQSATWSPSNWNINSPSSNKRT